MVKKLDETSTNAMGSSSSSSGPIQTFDPLLPGKQPIRRNLPGLIKKKFGGKK
jgi:hypothetical protein